MILAQSADQLRRLGEIELATGKLREALAVLETVGGVPGGDYAISAGFLSFSKADLEGVRNAANVIRKEQDEGNALVMEISSLREQDRFQEMREALEKSKAFMDSSGNRLEAAVLARGLCRLACDEDRPRDGLACLARSPPAPGMGDNWPDNQAMMACQYLAGDLPEAERIALKIRAGSSGNFGARILSDTYLMRIRAIHGETAKAIASLRADLAEAERKKAKAIAFEVALALGEVELRAGRPEGRPRLLKLEQEAKSREFFRIARLARHALETERERKSGRVIPLHDIRLLEDGQEKRATPARPSPNN